MAKHNFKDLLKIKQILNVSYVKRNIIQKITAILYYVDNTFVVELLSLDYVEFNNNKAQQK